MSGMAWAAVVDTALKVGDAWMQSSAAHKANRTNIQLQREQQKWEERMANSAVQRRKWDIMAAGGNPALAFTNGQEAATPSISPARVEPTYRGGVDTNFTAKALAAAQIKNVNADTLSKLADARSRTVEANIREFLADKERDFRGNRLVEEQEWDDLKTHILRNNQASTAAEAKRLNETVDSMIQIAKIQARTGKLDLDALENVARMGGLEANKATSIAKIIIDIIRTLKD